MRTSVWHLSCSVWHESHSVGHKSCNTDAVVSDWKAPMSDTKAAVSDLKATVSDTKVVVSDMRATVSDTDAVVSDMKAILCHWSCNVWHESHSLWHWSCSVWHESHSVWHWSCSIWYESTEYLILTRNSSVLTFLPLSVVDWLPTPLESSGYQYQWLNFCKKIQDSEAEDITPILLHNLGSRLHLYYCIFSIQIGTVFSFYPFTLASLQLPVIQSIHVNWIKLILLTKQQ